MSLRLFSGLLTMGASMLCLMPVAHAAENPLPEPLDALVKDGAEIRYLGNDAGLDGWVTFRNGQEQYFYATPDRQAIVLGVLFNAKGDAVTARQIDALRKKDPGVDALAGTAATPVPPADAPSMPAVDATAGQAPATAPVKKPSGQSKSEQLLAEAEASSWIALGDKKAPMIYTIIDPQCPHCHDMIEDVRKSGLLENGKLQIRLIPVGLMNEKSLKQAANLLEAGNPQKVLFAHLDGDAKALSANDEPNTQGVQRNMALMQNWKLDVTPFSVYRSKSGQIKILRGRPAGLTALVADLK